MIECLVFCEARGDAEVAQLLADRVLCDGIEWVDGVVEHVRRWGGERHLAGDADGWFVKWTRLKDWKGPQVHGCYGGANKGEWAQARKALVFTAIEHPEAKAVILVRDDDGKGRRADYETARAEVSGLAVVIAVPVPEREAWCIAAFEPADPTEGERLAAETARLSQDPRQVAHTLNPKRESHPRSTKRVLDNLTADDRARELADLRTLPLATLVTRGEAVGLAAYIDDLRERLLPLFAR